MGYVPAKKMKAKFATVLACMVQLILYDIRIHGIFSLYGKKSIK